jgi:hypothetical protein
MHEKIDEIQRQVDELIGLCAEAGADPKDDILLRRDRSERLGYLILKLQDGQFKEHQLRSLERRLLRHADAMQYYVEFQMLTALLREYYHPERQERILEKMKEAMLSESRR